MNFSRVAAAAVVAWIVSIGIGFAFLLVGFLAFAYAYAKGYEGGNGVMEGLRFGVVTALIIIGFGAIYRPTGVPA